MIFSSNKSYFIIPSDTWVLFLAITFLVTIILYILITKKNKPKRKKAMGVWLLVWLLTSACLFGFGIFGKFVDTKTIHNKEYSKKELAEDLQQLEKTLKTENPLYFTNPALLQQRFDSTYEKLEDGMTELEFYRLINPIVTSINCGHTNLSISEALLMNREQTAKFFPLKVTLVDNQLYLLEDDPAAGIVAGDEILSINGKKSEQIIAVLLKNINGDGDYESKRRYIISKHFNNKFYDFIDNSDRFQVVLKNKEGQTKTVNLQAKFRKEFNTTAWNLHFSEYKAGNYYDTKLFEDSALLTIHTFMNEKDNEFSGFLDEFFRKLRKENISKLIIDLRGNYGGDSFMAKELLSHLTTKEFDYFDSNFPFYYKLLGFNKPVTPKEAPFNGNVMVLTDGAVFSTAAHLTALIQYHHLGTIVGTETGGTYICTDGSKDLVLKNTRMRLHYSTLTFKVKTRGIPSDSGIRPKINVPITIDDILTKTDPTIQAAQKAFSFE